MADKLKVHTWKEIVTIKVLGHSTHDERNICYIDLFSKFGPTVTFKTRRAIIMDPISVEPQSIPCSETIEKYSFMHGISVSEPPSLQVDFIIGIDLAHTWCLPRDFRRGPEHLPFAVLTDWGWTIIGVRKLSRMPCHLT